jgi:uncharacterized membrane protein
MAQEQYDGVPSTAALGGHPIHPMLIVFPIAFLVGAFVSDVVYVIQDDSFWAEASRWLVGAGLVTGIVAAVAGLTDFLTMPQVREHSAAWAHFLGNGAALVLSLINLLLRRNDPGDAITPGGLIISLAVTLILFVTGWLGGELSYRHRIGVVPSRAEVSNRVDISR